jgi:hypothetical protein
MNKATTRDAATTQFWGDVRDLLTQKHGHSAGRAQQGIQQYQDVAKEHLGEVVYNQGEEQTAKVIDGIIRNGLPSANPY